VASPAPSAPPLPCSERHGVRGSLRGYGVRDGLPDTGGKKGARRRHPARLVSISSLSLSLSLSLVRGAATALLPALAPAVASRAGHARRPRPLLSLGAAWQQPRWPSLIGASLPRTAPPAMPHAGSGPPPAAPSSPALLGLAPPCSLRPPPPRLPPPAVLLELGRSCSDGRLLAAEASGCPLPACGSLSYHQCISWRPATDLISLPLTLTTAQVNRTRDTLLCQ